MSKANARGSQMSAQHGRAGSSSDLGDGRDSPVSMSSRHSGDYKTAAYAYSGKESRKENVMVVARFRPVNKLELTVPEKAGEEYSLLIDERQRIIGMRRVVTGKDKRGREESHNFVFDRVFGPQASQQQVFDEVARDVVTWTSEGYNTTIFAYGQTGSGKTYTMFGAENEPRLRGLIPRSVEQLFQEIADNPEIEEVTIKCSFLEIYKETIRDLLRGERRKDDYANFQPSLRIRQSRDRGVYVQGLIEKYVYSPSDVLDLIKQGEGTRSVGHTRMNEASSRSHAVLTLLVSETWKDGTVRLGKLHLVDLAGSENVGKSQASGETLQETQKINKSLSALGNVIYALTDNTRDHVPYRDSKLTYLLQDSLGGNTKTVLIVTCSPHESNYSETLSTLKFAKRAKNIENIPSINKQESVKQLKAVVQAMEEQLQTQESQIQEMTSVLGALGVERDSGGQFQLPKDGSRVAKVDARETAQYKLQIVQLQKKLAKAEKQNEKMDRIRKREQAYYTELKDLFAKQRELAVGLAEKLRVRDDTIRQMTLELEEYEKFQATIEAAFAANPALLAAMGLAQPSMEQARMRRMSTKHLREKSKQMTLDANDFAGLGVDGPGDGAQALQEIDQLEPEQDPPSEAEFPSEPPSPRDRGVDPKRPKGIAVQPSLPTRVPADQKSAAVDSLSASERAAKEAQQATKGRVLSGTVTEATAGGAKGAAAQPAETGSASRVMTEIVPLDADLDAKTAAAILANSAIFIKYPFSGGLLAKPTKKQMFYNADNDSVVYWDAGTKITNDSKAVPISAITHIFVGKKTPAFQRSTAKRAKDPCCFSIQSGDRTLDLEAETEWERDQWVSALRVLCDRRRKPGDPPLQFVGSVPNDVLSRARGSSKNLQSLATQSSFAPMAATPEAAPAPAPVKRGKKEAKVISDYSAEFEDGGAGGGRRGDSKDPSGLGGDLDDGDEAGAKKSGVGLEVGIGKRGDGADGADAAARKKRLGNLPDYRFRDITDVDVGEPTREDLIREVRTVKEEQRKIKHKLAEYRYDPIVALPAGSSKSISDMAAEQERRVQEIRTVLRTMGLPTDGPHNDMALKIQTFVRAFLWRCRDRNFRAIKRGRQPKRIKHPVPISVPIQRTASGKPVPSQAATRIQAAFRGSMARRRTREEITNTASVQIQRVFRGFRVRKRVHLGDFAGLLSLCTPPRTGKAALTVDTSAKAAPEVVAPPLSPTGLYATAPAANKKLASPSAAASKPAAEERKVPKTAVATPLVAAVAQAKQEPKAAAPAPSAAPAAAPAAAPVAVTAQTAPAKEKPASASASTPTPTGPATASGGSSGSVGGSEKKEKAPVDQDAAMTPDPKFLYRALYDFEGKNHLQLSFKKGDVLEIMSDRKSGWWQAKKGTKTGAIPFNYVRKLDKPSPAGGGTVA